MENVKTPYQGSKRCYGTYNCSGCKHAWKSAYSWANTRQKCIKCDTMVYPHKQQPLLDKDESTLKYRFVTKYHQPEQCERCLAGIPCQNRPEMDMNQLKLSLALAKQFLKADSRKKKAGESPELETESDSGNSQSDEVSEVTN